MASIKMKTFSPSSVKKKTVCDLTVTQHEPSPPLTGEWNCIRGSISSERSSFLCGFVYRELTSEVENHLCVYVCVFLRRCFLGAPRHPKVTGSLMRCFYTQGKWQRCGLRLWVTTQGGGGRAASVWWRAPIFTASLFEGFTERRGGYEDQVDWVKRCWRLCDDAWGLTDEQLLQLWMLKLIRSSELERPFLSQQVLISRPAEQRFCQLWFYVLLKFEQPVMERSSMLPEARKPSPDSCRCVIESDIQSFWSFPCCLFYGGFSNTPTFTRTSSKGTFMSSAT